MKQKLALFISVLILSACARPGAVTPTAAPTVTGVNSVGFGGTFYFLDDKHGWLLSGDITANPSSGILYRTQDGGTKWQSSSVNFATGYLVFVNASNGWMMADLGGAAGSNAVAIFQTTDGGQTWNQMYTNDPTQPGAASTLPLGGQKYGITPADMQKAWVGGVIYTPGVIYLYATEDAGKTWALQPVQIPSGYEQSQPDTLAPQFVTLHDAFLPVTLQNQFGGMLAVYYSHDGGADWALTPTLIPGGGTMDFVSATDGFVWNGTEFYVTHDGAKTWTTISPGVPFGDSFAGMDFITNSVGFVLTNDVTGTRNLYKTTDGGATWTTLGK